MAKSIMAPIKGRVLKWTRESAGFSVEEIAQRFEVEPETVHAWEAESSNQHPTMRIVRDLSNLYKRPLTDFFLPRPPEEKPLPHDFRRSPGEVAGVYSPALRRQLRFGRDRQELLKALLEDQEADGPRFDAPRVRPQDNPEQVGDLIRKLLGVSTAEQSRWRHPRIAYNTWRQKIEARSVLVFQFEGVDVESEAWGFSLVDPALPVIGINGKLAYNGRTFTMLHEFVHLLLGESSICDIDDYTPRVPADLAVEVFCNHAAAAALMPRETFLANDVVRSRTGAAADWTDPEIRTLAAAFSASEEAAVRRLLTFKRTTAAFYRQKRAEYLARRRRERDKQREESQKAEFRRNMAQRSISNLGAPFVRTVLDSYHSHRMTLADAAQHLDVRPPKVRDVRALLLGA